MRTINEMIDENIFEGMYRIRIKHRLNNPIYISRSEYNFSFKIYNRMHLWLLPCWITITQ